MAKQQQLITTAFELFYRDGVHATGINSVLSASGIAKKTLYAYFKSKDELIAATIRYRDEMFSSWIKDRVSRVDKGKDAIYELFSALNDWFNNQVPEISAFHGCYFINVAAEYSDVTDSIHVLCADHKRSILELIRFHVTACDVKKEDIDNMTNYIGMLKEGAIIQASVLGDLNAAITAREMALRLLCETKEIR